MAYVYRNGSLGRGLGDAAYDQAYAQYLKDHAAWEQAGYAYTSAFASWAAGEGQKDKDYAAAVAAYNAAHAADLAAAASWPALKQSLQAQGVVFPSSFRGCVTQAQHDAWQRECDQFSTVKGIGLVAAPRSLTAASTVQGIPTGNPCLLAQIPVCRPITFVPHRAAAAPRPAPPGPEPQPPAKPATPPPTTVVVQQQIPTPRPTTSIPNPTAITPGGSSIPVAPTTSSTVPAQASTKTGGMLSSGLILLVLAGGGYALYRTFKKPRASA